MDYRLFIPCAGLGMRVSGIDDHVNKALLTVARKPIIAHILDRVPGSVTTVVALGHKGATVRDFLELAYPERRFVFVEIDRYQGPGSGLGYTMLACERELHCPFVFCSNDTIVLDNIPAPDANWMGYAEVTDTADYRSLRVRDDLVVEICSKGALGDVKPYIGLAGIHEYQAFWEAMHRGGEDAIKIGESHGLRALLGGKVRGRCFRWFDTGNVAAYGRAREALRCPDEPTVLPKGGEALWFLGTSVFKFSTDEKFIADRVTRAGLLSPYVPEIVAHRSTIYQYRKVEGEVFSRRADAGRFSYLLQWLRRFWQPMDLSTEERGTLRTVCDRFYRQKTLERVQQYFDRFEQLDAPETVNGVSIPRVAELLGRVDWARLCEATPTRIHGDLHFENILINADPKRPFTLLDWRQDFGGLHEYGDLYYDLAKLYHGLIVSHGLIEKGLFQVKREVDTVEFDLLRSQRLVRCEQVLRRFAEQEGYDLGKIQVLTSLIFLNIAALHHYPYSLLLFYLGKSWLFELLSIDPQYEVP